MLDAIPEGYGIRIETIPENKHYTITNLNECRDNSDRSAAIEVLRHRDVITMGKTVARLLPLKDE